VLVERTRQKLKILSHDERLVQVARYCYEFSQDVVAVLADEDDFNLLVRLAAAQVKARDDRARDQQAHKGMRK